MAIDGNKMTFLAGEALAEKRRVKLSAANTIVYADSEEKAIGVTETAIASGAYGDVRLINAGGSIECTAAGAITAAAAVYAADDGKIDGAGTVIMGYANAAATADGDQIEVLFND